MDSREIRDRENDMTAERRAAVEDTARWVARVLSNRAITLWEAPVVLARCQEYMTVTAGDPSQQTT